MRHRWHTCALSRLSLALVATALVVPTLVPPATATPVEPTPSSDSTSVSLPPVSPQPEAATGSREPESDPIEPLQSSESTEPSIVGYRDPALAEAATVEVTGSLTVVAGEGGAPDSYTVTTDSGQVLPVAADFHTSATGDFVSASLALPDALAAQVGAVAGEQVTGTTRNAVLALAAGGTTLSVAQAAVRPATATTTAQRWLVAMPTNMGTFNKTEAQVMAMVELARQYWLDESDNAITIEVVPTAFRYASAYATAPNCGLSGATNFPLITDEAFRITGARPGSGDHVLVVVPGSCSSVGGAIGLGAVGSSFGQSSGRLIAALTSPFTMTVVHELGHNYGLGHANRSGCGFGNCVQEYGGYYEPMSGAVSADPPPALGTPFRFAEGILAPGEVGVLDPLAASDATLTTTATLNARAGETGQRSLTFIDPDTGLNVFVDYRDGRDRDALTTYALSRSVGGAALRPGVVIEALDNGDVWLDGPANRTSLAKPGDTWTNISGSMSVTLGTVGIVNGVGQATVTATYNKAPAFNSGSITLAGEARALAWAQASVSELHPFTGIVRYQWYADGVPLAGATKPDLLIPVELTGKTLSIVATAYAPGRHPLRLSTSSVVAPALLSRPGPLGISGAAVIGQTLTALGTRGAAYDALGNVVPTSSQLQWYRGDTAIPGATGQTYVVTSADAGASLWFTETVTASGYAPLQLRSALTPPIPMTMPVAEVPVVVATPTQISPPSSRPQSAPTSVVEPDTTWLGTPPRVSGAAAAGRRIRAAAGEWVSGTRLRYQWYLGRKPIAGATSASLMVKSAWQGKTLTVSVTGVRPGYLTITKVSRPIRVR